MDRILDPAQAAQFSYVAAADLPGPLTGLSDSIAFVWIERGVVRCQRATDAGPVVVPARTLVVLWCGALRRWTRERRPLRLQVVFAPHAWCVAREPADTLLRQLERGELVVDRHGSDDAGDWLRRWAEPGAMTNARRFRALMCELEARLLALDEGGAAPAGSPRESTVQQKARAMARHIEMMFPAQVSLPALAAYAHLAPGYAATVFRTCHGETPLAFLNRLRIAHARRLLAMTDLKVIEVGHESGFATTSLFYAQFRRACGVAPAAFRTAARQAALPSGTAPANMGERTDRSVAALMPVRHVILWVDDNPNGNFEERKRLFSFGILCDSYVTNASAVAAFRTGRYELVVSDINRPAGTEDGWALLRALRAVNPKAAVLLYTGRIHADVERAAVRRGAAGAFDRSGPLIAAILRLLARTPVPTA